jgi:hypothetical protein
MSERLSKLNEQKQLIEEHLRWLKLEIANELGESAPTSETVCQTNRPERLTESAPLSFIEIPAAALETEEEVEVDQIAEQIISQYGQYSASREMGPRLGLVLFFGGILGVIALALFLFYWFGYR